MIDEQQAANLVSRYRAGGVQCKVSMTIDQSHRPILVATVGRGDRSRSTTELLSPRHLERPDEIFSELHGMLGRLVEALMKEQNSGSDPGAMVAEWVGATGVDPSIDRTKRIVRAG